ncbi:hypothetical protein LSH36_511g01045, partial [Paralvinella palmiformis]
MIALACVSAYITLHVPSLLIGISPAGLSSHLSNTCQSVSDGDVTLPFHHHHHQTFTRMFHFNYLAYKYAHTMIPIWTSFPYKLVLATHCLLPSLCCYPSLVSLVHSTHSLSTLSGPPVL